MSVEEWTEYLKAGLREAEKYDTCMSLEVNEEGNCIELLLDTSLNTYGDWIPGEGGDMGLIREVGTKRVVGIRLPLLNRNLAVSHEGPFRLNDGFLKESEEG